MGWNQDGNEDLSRDTEKKPENYNNPEKQSGTKGNIV